MAIIEANVANDSNISQFRLFSFLWPTNTENRCLKLIIEIEKDSRLILDHLNQANLEMALNFAERCRENYNKVFLELTATKAFLDFQVQGQEEIERQLENPPQLENQQQIESHVNTGVTVTQTGSDESGESRKSAAALLDSRPQVSSIVEKNLLDQILILISNFL